MTHDPDHDLRALDPTSRNTNGLSDRALDDLNRIMSTRSGDPTSSAYAGARAARAPHRSKWVTRALPIAAAAAALAVFSPSLYSDDSAFASWTAQPAAPAVDDVEEAGRVCADLWTDAGTDPLPNLRVALAEQRGDWTYTVMTTSDGQYVDCTMQLDRGVLGNLFGNYRGGGGSLAPLPAEPPAADRIEAMSYSGTGGGDSDVAALAVSGRVGADVTGVVAHTPDAGDVQATVQDGYWAAWWPTQFDRADGPEMDGLSFTVTLRDGSTFEATYDDVAARLG